MSTTDNLRKMIEDDARAAQTAIQLLARLREVLVARQSMPTGLTEQEKEDL